MGLPQLDFRVPEATWFKSALAGKFGAIPGMSSTGALAWPYKIAVVAVMALVASGTLVTFGSAGAETTTSAEVAALPGSDEASPSVEGQVIPPSNSLLNGADLLATLNLADYSPGDTTLSLSDEDDDDEDSDEDSDEDTKADTKKKLAAAKPTPTTSAKPTTSPTTSAPSPKPTTSAPTTPAPTPTKTTAPPPPPKEVCKTVWVKDGSLLGGHFEKQCS